MPDRSFGRIGTAQDTGDVPAFLTGPRGRTRRQFHSGEVDGTTLVEFGIHRIHSASFTALEAGLSSINGARKREVDRVDA